MDTNEEFGERLARVETKVELIPEIREDLKKVIEYQNRQKGQATVLGLLLTALVGIGSFFGGRGVG